MKTRYLLGLTATALLSAAALGGCEQRRDNATLTTAIRGELTREQLPSSITVAVADGVANLGGTVRDADSRAKAEDVAEDVDGVQRVINNIRVTTAAGDAPANPPRVAPQYNLPESGAAPSGAGNEPAARPGMGNAPDTDAGPHPR